MKQSYIGVILAAGAWLMVSLVPGIQAFHFIQPEQRMVEALNESFPQTQPAVTFDPAGNVHVVYCDTRSSSVSHFFGATLMPNGVLTASYRTHHGIETDTHIQPFVLPGSYYPNHSYIGGINTSGTLDQCVIGYMETSSLPAIPPVTDEDSFTLSVEDVEGFDVIGGGFFVFYVYDAGADLHLNSFDEQTGTWGTETILSSPVMEEVYNSPGLAMDESGFIYLTYDVFDSSNTQSYAKVRRSFSEYSVSGFSTERTVDSFFGAHAFTPKIAVTGKYSDGTLKVAIAYRYPSESVNSIIGNMEENYDWTQTVSEPFYGTGPYNISSILGPSKTIYGPDIVYDAADDLFIVWSDDRDNIFKLYGNVSYDGGVTMLSSTEAAIQGGIAGIYGEPDLTAGPNPGDLALAYSRNTGVYINPYLLLSRATFFDSCENDPGTTGFWTTYSGVTVNNTIFYSEPASYQMGTSKGMLLRDFGMAEQQGSVTLQFYDTGSTAEDFYVALENGNLKGVIRMLGVRNDTTQSNYSYSYDDVTWVDLGAPRTVGWHEITFDVNGLGLVMSVGLDGGGVASKSDPAFTSFTRVEMQGGSGSSPYFVDDIRVEAYPALVAPPPLPASSAVSVLVLLILVGILIAHKRAL